MQLLGETHAYLCVYLELERYCTGKVHPTALIEMRSHRRRMQTSVLPFLDDILKKGLGISGIGSCVHDSVLHVLKDC